MRTSATLICAILLCGLVVSPGHGQAPDSLSFQGKLTDSLGDPIPDGNYSIRFRMYKGPTQVWEQTHPSVPVESGLVNVVLGGTPTWPLDTVAFDQPIDLGIKVGADPEMSPRTPLMSSAYALGMRGMYAFYDEYVGASTFKSYNVIGGAPNNGVDEGEQVTGATISGGGGILLPFSGGTEQVRNFVSQRYGTIGGGYGNTVNNQLGTIGGGAWNTAGGSATVGGGQVNTAYGVFSVIGGGSDNVASGGGATVPGGGGNQARGLNSFAAGQNARAAHDRSFVWSDGTAATDGVDSLVTSAEAEFLVKASGGITFFSNSDTTAGVHLAPGTGAWAVVSDANKKTGFGQLDPKIVLDRLESLPIQTWRYKDQSESIRHMGPTSQDFYRAFGLGIDDRHIVTVDADGVALAAIQGLYELVKEQQALVEGLQEENVRMRAAMRAAGIE